MKKILIVISDMGLGGAQRSLLSFLKCLNDSQQKTQYEIDLMVVNPVGGFYAQIPQEIKQLMPPKALRWLGTAFSKKLVTKHFSFNCVFGQVKWLLKKKLGKFPKQWNIQQKLWSCWKDRIPALPGHYDAAISYIDGFPNYYIMEKVSAKKKVLWIHNEYQKLQYDPEYDRPFYEKADGIITISDKCRQCILEAFPQLQEKVHILENISVSSEVLKKSGAGDCSEFLTYDGLKLLSVGRLNAQKGYDLAIDSAKILRDQGISFLWLVLGDGPERQSLQQQIDRYNLNNCFRLLGNCENPYGYMADCDFMVQSSRFEGKSVVLDEAKILSKPVVVTNYTTAKDAVEHGKTGWITPMSALGIAEGIMKLHQDAALQSSIVEHLQALPKGNEAELQKYIQYML